MKEQTDTRFDDIDYLIDANDHERLYVLNTLTFSLVENGRPIYQYMGTIDELEVWCQCSFYKYNNKSICFFYPSSTIVDWSVIDQ